jgi:hypothetical protein
MATYRTIVEYRGRVLRAIFVTADDAMLACEKAERYMAMEREGSLDNLPDYFANSARVVEPPVITFLELGAPINPLGGRF